MELPAWARPVIPGPGTSPLLYAGTLAGRPAAVMAFEPRRSDLPLQVAFPVLLANLAGELLGGSETPQDAIAPGAPVTPLHPCRGHRRAGGAPGRQRRRARRPGRRRTPASPSPAPTSWASTPSRPSRTRLRPRRRTSGTHGRLLAASPSAALASPGASPTFRPADPSAPVRFAVGPARRGRVAHRPRRHRPADRRSASRLCEPWNRGRNRDWVRADAPVERPERPRRDLDPDRARRAAGSHVRVARVRARHARADAPRARCAAAREPSGRRGRLMGINFDAPARAPAAPAAARRGGRAAPASRAAPRAWAGGGRRSLVRVLLLSALVFALAGFQLVLPVDRLAVVYVVDLSDSVGTAGREEALAYLRESLAAKQDEDVAGIVAFGGDALVERLPSDLAEIDRIASTPVTRRHGHRRRSPPGGGTVPRRRPEADRPALRRQRHHRLRPDGGGAGRGAGHPGPDAPDRPRRRGRGPRGAAHGAVHRAAAASRCRSPRTSRPPSPSQPPRASSSTASSSATKPVDLAAGANRVEFQFTAKEAGFLRFRVAVEAARDTFNQNDRADANTIVKGEPTRPRGQGRRGRRRSSWWPRSRPSASPWTPSSPRRSRRTSRGSRTTTRSSWWTCRGSGSPTRRWPRCRSTCATWVAGS